MQYQQFLERVQQRMGAGGIQEAERATSATLATLGERISGGEAGNLSAQLPKEIEAHLLGDDRQEAVEGFSLEEFYRRVAGREGLSVGESTEHARAVMRVLSEAVGSGKLSHLQLQLPTEFGPLLGTAYHYGEFIVRVQERAVWTQRRRRKPQPALRWLPSASALASARPRTSRLSYRRSCGQR